MFAEWQPVEMHERSGTLAGTQTDRERLPRAGFRSAKPNSKKHLQNRDGRIRTGDPLNPIQVRYRTAPRPETTQYSGTVRPAGLPAGVVNPRELRSATPILAHLAGRGSRSRSPSVVSARFRCATGLRHVPSFSRRNGWRAHNIGYAASPREVPVSSRKVPYGKTNEKYDLGSILMRDPSSLYSSFFPSGAVWSN